jgi:hypothetical protein
MIRQPRHGGTAAWRVEASRPIAGLDPGAARHLHRPFGGPQAVLAYLSRYTHRVALANSRLIACDHNGVTFKWRDYRVEGPARYKVMTLATGSSSAASSEIHSECTYCMEIPPPFVEPSRCKKSARWARHCRPVTH